MRADRRMRAGLLVFATLAFAGCAVVPSEDLAALRAQNRVLTENQRAGAAQLESLRIHARNVEDQLKRAEEELATVSERSGLDRRQLTSYQQEHEQLRAQFVGMASGRFPPRPETAQRVAALSQKFPGLKFDPQTGIAKFDTDILFDAGAAELKPGAEKSLSDLVALLNAPEARDLRILVVGHTDGQQVAKKPAREKYPDNFYLSADRALAVSAKLRQLGLPEQRLGVSAMGAHEPVAPNVSAKDRQKNRRVELFVMAPDVPIVGWTETTPSLY